jgi:hypothetical protein
MLDQFFSSLEIDDVSDLNYTEYTPYNSQEQKEDVLEKIDWVLLKLHKIKDRRKYDYDIVMGIKNRIRFNDCSLTTKGVEFLNVITTDLKQDIF